MAYKTSNPNGQATMANSEPVVLASDQSDVKVTLDSETVVLAAGNNNIGDVDVASLPAIPAGTNVIGITRVQDAAGDEISIAAFPSADSAAIQTNLATSSFPLMYNGTNWDRVRGSATDGLTVNLGSNNDVTVASLPLPTGAATAAAQLPDGHNVTVDNASGAAAVNIQDGGNTITVDGTVAVTGVSTLAEQQTQTTHLSNIATSVGTLDNAISGNEMQVDVVAALPAGNNNIGDVDVASLPALAAGTNAIGKVLPPDVDVTTHTNYIKKYYTSAGAATDGIIWSPAAGKRWHVVSMFINTSAAATITLEDDLAAGDSAVMKMELAANSGTVINFSEKYPLASGEDAADLLITTSAGNVYVTVTGYEI